MNIISQHQGQVKGYRVKKKGLGYTLLLLLKTEDVKEFYCSSTYQVLAGLRDVGFNVFAFDPEKETE